MLEVLHFSTSDIEGGSARSAWRIHTNIAKLGARSRMLVGWKRSESRDVETVSGSRLLQIADNKTNAVLSRIGFQYGFVPSSLRVIHHPWIRSANVIQLYNIHGGYFNPSLIPDLSRSAPLVWRLSDLWPLTGHCAYPGNCDRWLSGCGPCPDLNTYPPIGCDMTARLWTRKNKLYRKSNITIVAPSSWTEDAARRSPLLGNFRIELIPNGIDTKRYIPQDRAAARAVFGITDNRPAILFCAHVAFNNPRKGTDLLTKALRKLASPKDSCMIVAGIGAEQWRGTVPLDTHPLGYLTDEDKIVTAYAAADIVVVPSAVENLPNTVLEALAMGKPVIAVDSGGMRDAVHNGETGFLTPGDDAEALTAALNRVLGNRELAQRLGKAGRALIERSFDQVVEAKRFMELYTELVEESNA